jgi:hypothetical protein
MDPLLPPRLAQQAFRTRRRVHVNWISDEKTDETESRQTLPTVVGDVAAAAAAYSFDADDVSIPL